MKIEQAYFAALKFHNFAKKLREKELSFGKIVKIQIFIIKQ